MIFGILYEVKKILIYYVLLIIFWIGAWLFYEWTNIASFTSTQEFLFWTVAKLCVWIVPIFLIIKFYFKQPIISYLSLSYSGRAIRTGIIYGLIFIGLSFFIDIFARGFALPLITAGFINAIIIAPLFEEVVFRGFVLGTLQKSKVSFWFANFVAALMFLGIHVPGWYFMGSLTSVSVITIFSILVIGLIAGYAKERSGSTWASVFFHFINNLYSAFIK